MSSSWPRVRLDEIFSIARGGSPRPIEKFLTEDPDGVNWIMIGDASEGAKYISSTKKRIVRTGMKNSRFVNPGDFLLTNSMSFGRPYIMSTSGCIHDGWLVLSPRNGKTHADYFYHLLGSKTIYAEFERRAAGVTVKNLNIDLVRTVEVLLPPLAEQRRIAGVLDREEALRAKRRAALAQLDSLTQSLFLDLFGDPASNPHNFNRTTLGEIIEFVGGSQPPRETFTYEPAPDTIRLVQIRDFRSDEFKTYIPRRLARRFFEQDDVMIGRYGPPVFQILRGLSGSYNVALIKTVPRNGVLKDFIFHLLQEPRLHSYVVSRSERTAGQSGVNLELLENYPAYLPPLPLQQTFARRVAAVERLKAGHRAALAHLDALFASLQHRAFRGEL
jgi:type I restriction enzyme S subunit